MFFSLQKEGEPKQRKRTKEAYQFYRPILLRYRKHELLIPNRI